MPEQELLFKLASQIALVINLTVRLVKARNDMRQCLLVRRNRLLINVVVVHLAVHAVKLFFFFNIRHVIYGLIISHVAFLSHPRVFLRLSLDFVG